MKSNKLMALKYLSQTQLKKIKNYCLLRRYLFLSLLNQDFSFPTINTKRDVQHKRQELIAISDQIPNLLAFIGQIFQVEIQLLP